MEWREVVEQIYGLKEREREGGGVRGEGNVDVFVCVKAMS